MSEQQIARELFRITQLPVLEFQQELKTVIDSTLTIRLLADLLASDLSNEQKQLAAAGINRVIEFRLEPDTSRWRRLWEEFLREVLNHQEKNRIAWSHLSITTRGLFLILEDAQSQLCDLITPVFQNLSFPAQCLLYQTFLNLETTQNSRYVFLRETIEDFLHNAFTFAASLHDQPSPPSQLVQLELSSLKVIEILLSHLAEDIHEPLIEMLTKLSLNTDLFLLIAQELLYEQREGYRSLLRRQFSNDLIPEITFGSKNIKREECKTNSIQIFCYAVRRYDFRSGIEEFDTFRMLNLLEQLCPLAINWLASGRSDQQASGLIELLVGGCRFNFMLQVYTQKFLEIYYRICIPFLTSGPNEIDIFENDGEQFIAIAEELCERTDDRSLTTRSQAGLLLEQIVDACHGTLPSLVSSLIAIIRHYLCGEDNEEHIPPALSFGPLPSLQTAFTVLAIFSSKYSQRKELLEEIRREVFIDQLLRVRGLDKARVLLFLAYNYEQMFRQRNQQGWRWLEWAEVGLDENGAMPLCSLLIFQNCFELGLGANIWSCLLKRISTTKLRGLIKLLNKIIKKSMDKLPAEAIIELMQRIIERMDRQCELISKDNEVYRGSDMLYACLAVIETASQNKKYLKEQSAVIQSFWPVLNLLRESEKIEFQDNILKIYNNLLHVSVSESHFSFLPHFTAIITKRLCLAPYDRTLPLLLQQSRSLFHSSEGPLLLNNLLTSLQEMFFALQQRTSLAKVCSFLHYAYYSYGELIQQRDFFRILKDSYNDKKDRWNDQNLAAVVNLMLMGATLYGKRELVTVGENHIEIFRGYQAKLLAVGMRKWIEREWQSEQLLQYMRYCIRLLHFVREQSLSTQRLQPYFSPEFSSLNSVDPFAEITITLDFLKHQLSHSRYDRILQDLSEEISLGEIRDLLSRRIIERSMRHFVKINRNN